MSKNKSERAKESRLKDATYEVLRGMASRLLRDERSDHTLQATDLVHEAFLTLCGQEKLHRDDDLARQNYLFLAARVMRNILVDHARRRGALRRGGDRRRIHLEEITEHLRNPDADICAVDQALETLAGIDPRKAQIVELRFFGGCTIEETARVLQISTPTVERDWAFAKAWLAAEIDRRLRDQDHEL